MKTMSEQEIASLFTIEKISPVVTPSISILSGCDICQHCTLLRLLAKNRLDECKKIESRITSNDASSQSSN